MTKYEVLCLVGETILPAPRPFSVYSFEAETYEDALKVAVEDFLVVFMLRQGAAIKVIPVDKLAN